MFEIVDWDILPLEDVCYSPSRKVFMFYIGWLDAEMVQEVGIGSCVLGDPLGRQENLVFKKGTWT